MALSAVCTMPPAAGQPGASAPAAADGGARRSAPAKPPPGALRVQRAGEGKPGAASKASAAQTVGQLCTGKGYWAREWCETKACFKSEHRYDPLCKQRREQRPANQP